MTGVGLHIDLTDLDQVQRRLEALGGFDRRDLLETIGAAVESQTRRRIADEKTDPEGNAWPDWSTRYADTRHGGHSLLIGEGDLLDSINFLVSASEVEVGSNLIYAATHHFGDEDRSIPQRAFLGLSPDDETEVQQVISDWFQEVTA